MKKIIALAFTAVSLAACNNAETEKTTVDTDTTSTTTCTESTSAAYTPAEGDVTFRGSKVKVMKNGEWVDADKDVTLDDGVVVYRNGKVTKDGKEIELEDGEVVTRTGNFFDRAGNAMENAWDATKEGAKKAGRAVGDAADTIGKKMKNAVDDDDNH